MMGALRVIPAKVVKLIPLLSSDNDGEALSTVRAIDRTLEAAGLDWHALAQAVSVPVASTRKPQPAGWSDLSSQPPRWGELSISRRVSFFTCAQHFNSLTAWERDFLFCLGTKFEANAYASVSPKQ